MLKRRAVAVLFLCALAPFVAAKEQDESAILLKDGAGRDLVEANCAACHSLDYVVMNSAFLDQKGWAAEVTKMVNVFGASIDDPTQAEIVNYLVQAYGMQ
jgi:sulfite dehydrogenase (cytochrome) subunit B